MTQDDVKAKVNVPTADQLNKAKSIHFYVDFKKVKIEKEGDHTVIRGIPVQAAIEDRDGDILTEDAQRGLIDQINTGLIPAFPNHGIGDHMAFYDFRDIMGQWLNARDQDGTTVADLRLRNDSPSGDHLKDLVDQEMPVGFSIGFIPKDVEDRDDAEGHEINNTDLLEISPVGIPSNPAAVPGAAGVDQMLMAAKNQIVKGASPETVAQAMIKTLNGDKMTKQTNKDDSEEVVEEEAVEEEAEEVSEEPTEEQVQDEDKSTKQDDEDEEEEEDSKSETLDQILAFSKANAERLDAILQFLKEEDEDEEEDSKPQDDEDEDEEDSGKDADPEDPDEPEDPGDEGLEDDEKTVKDSDEKRRIQTLDDDEEEKDQPMKFRPPEPAGDVWGRDSQ